MFGLGISELLIYLVVACMGVGSLGVLYLVVRAVVRAGNRGPRSEVGDLKKAVEAQSSEIRELRDRLPPPPAKAGDGKAKEIGVGKPH